MSLRRLSERWRWEWLLALTLGFSLILRWPMGGLDLEHYVGPDEGEVVENTLEMMKTGYLHQRHPGYPALHFYIQMVPATAYFLSARARGQGNSIRELPREGFYRVARWTTLLAGWLAALVVYFIGRRWLGGPTSLLAAALVALSPLALRESKVVNPDLMLMLFVACGLGLSLRALEKPNAGRLAQAGTWVGLASAIKYTGVLLAVPYAFAWLFGEELRRSLRWASLGGGLAFAAFVMASPYTVIDWQNTIRGLNMHVGYYQAAEMNASAELIRNLSVSGLGLPAAFAAFVGSLWVLGRLEKQGIVVLSFLVAYVLLFSFFQRSYPRHALVLLPSAALLAALSVRWCFESGGRFHRLGYAACVVLLAVPLVGSVRLGLAARRTTPAMRAFEWIERNLPEGSRILEDQFTPRLDGSRYHVHRLRVEEKIFAGNFDYVLHSGYPPGLPIKGFRSVMRFEREGGLGDAITLYQVPERESLMRVTLPAKQSVAVLRAGELPFFGVGWLAPTPGAFGTSRLSSGSFSEIFFVVEEPGGKSLRGSTALKVEVRTAVMFPEALLAVRAELNGQLCATFEIRGEEPQDYDLVFSGPALRTGLNRVVLHYGQTVRINRRHREAAIRFFSMKLTKVDSQR